MLSLSLFVPLLVCPSSSQTESLTEVYGQFQCFLSQLLLQTLFSTVTELATTHLTFVGPSPAFNICEFQISLSERALQLPFYHSNHAVHEV